MPSLPRKKMKIAVVHWLVNDVGGINSWTENIILGLKRMGYDPQLFYGTNQRSLNCDPHVKIGRSRRYHLLPALHLSYLPQFIESSVSFLKKFDVVIFAHPSPHPTKSNLRNGPESRGWQEFYKQLSSLKISVFHDRHWDRTNEWVQEVAGHVDYVHAAQHHFIESVNKYPSPCRKDWGYFPLVLNKNGMSIEKTRSVVLATQWLAIKNHRYLLPTLNRLCAPLYSYGSGQTYHKLLPLIQEQFREDHHYDTVKIYNKKSKHIHYGHTEYSQVMMAMSKSWFSLDLSIQGMTNMTHWEPMTVGSISLLEDRVASDPFCEIPGDCCLQFNLQTVVEDLNKILKMPTSSLYKIQERSWKFIQRCDCTTVARDLLKKSGAL